MSVFDKPSEIPILFEEIYRKESTMIAKERDAVNKGRGFGEGHLFVFVHGFQGNSYDTRLMKNATFIRFQNCQFLCSSNNESHTEGDIEQMGERLAREIISFIK